MRSSDNTPFQPVNDSRYYSAFVKGVASWFGAWGMHAALFSWLLVVELDTPARWVGLAQTASMIPTLLLVLFGGALADRVDARRLLITVHLMAGAGPAVLAALLVAGKMNLTSLIVYALWTGAVAAFIMPARDTLLSRVAGPDMLKAVTGMTLAQFVAQALGNLLAGAAHFVGGAPMLLVQTLVLTTGAWLATHLPSAPPTQSSTNDSTLRQIGEGFSVVTSSPELRFAFILVAAIAFFFAGPFHVIIPLVIRDEYNGGAFHLALALMMFPVGAIIGSEIIRRRGGPWRDERALLLSLAGGISSFGFIGFGPSFPALLGATAIWGLFGSVFINGTRTIFQESAPGSQRARVLSIYQLGFMGAAPIGSVTAGFLVGEIGNHAAIHCIVVTMIVLLVLLWGVRRYAAKGA